MKIYIHNHSELIFGTCIGRGNFKGEYGWGISIGVGRKQLRIFLFKKESKINEFIKWFLIPASATAFVLWALESVFGK